MAFTTCSSSDFLNWSGGGLVFDKLFLVFSVNVRSQDWRLSGIESLLTAIFIAGWKLSDELDQLIALTDPGRRLSLSVHGGEAARLTPLWPIAALSEAPSRATCFLRVAKSAGLVTAGSRLDIDGVTGLVDSTAH
jgi:hypothetical protein